MASIVGRFTPGINIRLRPVGKLDILGNLEDHIRSRFREVNQLKERLEELTGNSAADLRLPYEMLRFRVHGSNDAEGFLRVGERCAQDIEIGLARVGRDIRSFERVLDFGCGCGRTLRWYARTSKDGQFHGTDTDSEAIAWCRENLVFAEFRKNNPLPPLSYDDGTFDLIFVISVFTHLNEDYQLRWLAELKRITKPGGIVILTFHGPTTFHQLNLASRQELERVGMFYRSGDWKGIFPDWFGTAFHTPEYLRRRFTEFLELLDYVPQGLNKHQDMGIFYRNQ